MNGTVAGAPVHRRDLGTVDSGRPGPTVLVLAGMHGNEPAGVTAVQRVIGQMQELELLQVGRVVTLAGNLAALSAQRRFIVRDLNRGWGADAIAALLARDEAERSVEDKEQCELLRCFEHVLHSASGPVVVIDLHTSSADGPPFSCLADTIDNRRLGFAAGVPILLGIEETIDGASLEWFAQRGVVALAIEGGRHASPDTVRNHEAVLWLVLEHLRLLRAGSFDVSAHREHLRRARAGVPSIVEIVRRHAIAAADGFVMEPGFANFTEVAKGQLLARDVNGEIRAPSACRVVLPLYQALGDDGFFLARRVRPFWLQVARWLRALRLDVLARWLPGVQRDAADPNTILVDPRVARWWVTEIFHLLGFRKERRRGHRLAFTRRWSRPENRRL